MTRRRVGAYSPTEAAAIAPELLENVVDVFTELTEREAGILRLRFGLNGPLLSYQEIAKIYGVNAERIRYFESKALSKVRHPKRAERLRDWAGAQDSHPVPRSIRERILQIVPQQPAPIWCDTHGWTLPDEYQRSRPCGNCPCLMPLSDTGRPRQYCSPLCRQQAHRERRRQQRDPSASSKPPS